MDKPTTIQDRQLVGPLWYYGCCCGEPRGGHLLTGFEGLDGEVLLTGDGLIFGWWGEPDPPDGIVLTKEVGRVRCHCLDGTREPGRPHSSTCPALPGCGGRPYWSDGDRGDHVFYAWRFVDA